MNNLPREISMIGHSKTFGGFDDLSRTLDR